MPQNSSRPSLTQRASRSWRGLGRRAFTLVEVLVAVAVMAILFVISLPAVNAIFEIEQRAAVRELGQTYTWLMDEAALRNVTFCVVFIIC